MRPPSGFRMCYDIPLITDDNTSGDRGIAQKDIIWKAGDTITIAFLDGTPIQRANFEQGLNIWAQYVNLNFLIVNDPSQAVVRVSHQPNVSWSELGTNCRNVTNAAAPTINIGWDGMDVILHEIGHLLGLLHEHQNPEAGILWNKPFIITAMTGAPHNWTTNMVRRNIFNKYSVNRIIGTRFDPISIMNYPIPSEWTLDGFSSPWNHALSETDIAFVKELYPFQNNITDGQVDTSPMPTTMTMMEDGTKVITANTDSIIINNGQVTANFRLTSAAAWGFGIWGLFRVINKGNERNQNLKPVCGCGQKHS